MIAQQQIDQFRCNGFLNAGPVLEESFLAELTVALDQILKIGPDGFEEGAPQPVSFRDLSSLDYADDRGGDKGESPTPVWQIINIWEAAPAFRKLIFHPYIVDAISRLTGFEGLQVWHDQVQYKPAGTGGSTLWHQDAPLWPSIEPMTPVSAWIPLDDAGTDNGCMWMVPGSQEWGDNIEYLTTHHDCVELEDMSRVGRDFTPPAGGPTTTPESVACPVKRGEVHFHHSLTWHGSPKNHSARPRRAVAIHYMTSEAVYTGRSHSMAQFIEVDEGEAMLNAGAHFPVVRREGVTQSA